VRTTLTLDEDVAAKLRAEARKTDRSFRETVNEALRRGLAAPRVTPARRRFTVAARDLGELRPGLSLDNIGELLDRIEGPLHR
jgi:plasmid stability protein